MISKLVQLRRAFSLNEVEPEEPEYLKVQYWVTSVSCFAVLVFLFFVIRWSLHPSSCLSFCSSWYAKIILCCILVYSTLCCMSLATITQDGEALLVTAGLILYFGDMLANTISEVQRNFSTPVLAFDYGIKRSEISVIIQGMLVGLLLFPVLAVPITKLWGCFIRLTSFRAFSHNEIHRALIFYSSLAFLLTLIIPSWMQFVHDFPVHPHLWYYHLMAVSMFLPALIFQPKFLD